MPARETPGLQIIRGVELNAREYPNFYGDILEQYETHREILHLPEYVIPCAMLAFGYSTKQQKEQEKPAC